MTRAGAAAAVLLAATATLVVGFAVKNECTYHGWDDHYQYRRYCYSDILPLYGIRHLDVDTEPYAPNAHDNLSDPDLTHRWGFSEYPVLTGYFTWAVAWMTDGLHAYMVLTFGLLLLCGLLATLALSRLGVPPGHLLLWAGGPALLVHAYTNWDLVAVALTAGGWLAWTRSQWGLGAGLFGLGGAAKLYPAFFLPLLFLERVRARDRPGAAATLLGGTIGFGFPNLYAYERSPDLWWEVWRFHARRSPDFETPWEALRSEWLQPLFPTFDWGDGWRELVGNVGAGALLIALALLAVLLWKRRVDALTAGGLLVLVFLLTNRVYSPQYTLWAVPVLVILRAPWWPLLGYLAADALNFLVRYPYFTPAPGGPPGSWNDAWAPWSRFAVAARWVILLWLTVALCVRLSRARTGTAAPRKLVRAPA